MRLRRRSIQHKILLLVLTICLIPAILFLVFVAFGSRVIIEETMGESLQTDAIEAGEQFDQFVTRQLERFRTLAAAWPSNAESLLYERSLYAVVVMDAAGRADAQVVAQSNPREPETLLPQLEPVFRRAWQGHESIKQGAALLDAAITVPGYAEPQAFVLCVVPRAQGGQAIFVIPAASWITQFRDSLGTAAPQFAIFRSDAGFAVHATRQADETIRRRLDEEAGSRREQWFPVSGAAARYLVAPRASRAMIVLRNENGGLGAVWTLFLVDDLEIFLGPQSRLIWLSVLIALALVLMLMAMASIATQQLILPLKTLRRQAELLAQGQLDVRASVHTRDEIGEVGEAFNIMAGRLRAMYGALEQRAEENRRHAEHINVINELANAIIREQNMAAIFEILRRQLGRLLRFDALWIALFDGQKSDLRVTEIDPMRLISLFDHGRIPLSWSLHGRVLDSRETLHAEIGPAHRTEFFETRIFNAEGFQSYLIAPLPYRDQLIGTLTVASSEPDAYNSELAAVMSSLAQAVAIAIEHAEMFQQVSRFASELEKKVVDRGKELAVATQKLIQTEKYFATGRLAGNIAHEINNPLGIIKNYLLMVRNNLQRAGGGRRATDPNLEHVGIIDEEVNRIARLVRQMMDLHRPVEPTVQAVDLNALILDTLAIMEQSFRRASIEVVRELATDLPQVMASPDLLRQVIINLVRNAQDAMEQGGRLTVRTSAILEWTDGAGDEPGYEREFVRVRISDTGCGIAPEHLSQIFDPFFTTKSPEKGTGLGLGVSYSIVQMYHGSIEVESEVGQGTTFVISLPVATRD